MNNQDSPSVLERIVSLHTSRKKIFTLGEVMLIVAWALFVGRRYLNLDASQWIFGGDFPLNVQSFFIWTWVGKCGLCALWNGAINGGSPTLGDQFGGFLHPIVFVPTLIWGVVNGTKIATVVAFALAGIAQWWIAKAMRLGAAARLWVAALAVTGGHLVGRLDLGWVVLIISIATASLVIAPALDIGMTGRRRAAVTLGLMLTLTLFSGQGYAVMGIAFAIAPALLIFLFDGNLRLSSVWKPFALAAILALLLSAIYWIPLANFYPNISKPYDPSFSGAQPAEYAPLNLVVADLTFFHLGILGMKPFPSIYVNYIGWVPILFGLFALRLIPRGSLRVLVFFLTAIGLVYLASSATFFRLAATYIPNLTGARHPSLIATLAVPLILAVAAWGLDLASKLSGVHLTIGVSPGVSARINIWSLTLLFLALAGLKSTYDFSQSWILVPAPSDAYAAVQATQLDQAEWVQVPRSRHDIFLIALESDQKVAFHPDERGWAWRGRDLVPAYMTMTTDPVSPSAAENIKSVGNISILLDTHNEYAFVDSAGSQIPCRAHAIGGSIDVTCESDSAGTLVVREYQWTGWNVWIDGVSAQLEPSEWLRVKLASGRHSISFRYLPFDAALGALITLLGIALSVLVWRRSG